MSAAPGAAAVAPSPHLELPARAAVDPRSDRQHAAARRDGAGAAALSPRVRLYAKLEGFNPGGSVKDRAALWMVRDGLRQRRAAAGQDDHRLDLGQHRHRAGDDRRRARLSGRRW